MLKENKLALYASGLIFIAAIGAIGLLIPRHQSIMLGLTYLAAFVSYYWLSKAELSFESVFQFGVTARLILFFGMPTLSDDIYRFLWDGQLLHQGLNPYVHLPDFYLEKNLPHLNRELYEKLNSKAYYSVYPPFNQLFFWIGTGRAESWIGQTNALRLILLFAEIGSLFYLKKLLPLYGKKQVLLGWFFLNPLIVLEVTGNLHFEGMVLFFLLFGLYQIETQRIKIGGFGLGFAIATKLLPLIYLPAVLFKTKRKNGILICAVALSIGTISFSPLLTLNSLTGISSSLGLYFQTFEFNASIYYLIREIGFWIVGYNMIATIGPYLSWITLFSISGLAIWGKRQYWSLPKLSLFSLSIYLLLATTVHPWYILPLIAFGLLSGYYFPIVWSSFIFATYFGYTETGYVWSPVWIFLEYAVVGMAFLWEERNRHLLKNSPT